MKVYISGPMSGYREYNYPAFKAAAEDWRRDGHEVVCPTEVCADMGFDKRPQEYMRKNLEALLECGAIAVLPNWHQSVGASAEVAVALVLGMSIFDAVHKMEYKIPAGVYVRPYDK